MLAVFVAVASGLAMAGIAGARRTASVLDRAVETTEAWDVLVNPEPGATALTVEAIAALPMVADACGWTRSPSFPKEASAPNASSRITQPDGQRRWCAAPLRPSRGRRRSTPRPDEPGELFVDRSYADDAGLEIGDAEVSHIVLDDLDRFFTRSATR